MYITYIDFSIRLPNSSIPYFSSFESSFVRFVHITSLRNKNIATKELSALISSSIIKGMNL